mgnify:CR=1 FL=1
MMINNGLTDRDTIGQTYTISANKSTILDLASLILQKKIDMHMTRLMPTDSISETKENPPERI